MSKNPDGTGDISIERFLNQSTIQSPSEPVTDRQISLADGAATVVTATAACIEMQLFNNTGQTLNYGGSTVTGSTGVKFFNQSTMVIKSPQSGFKIYFYQNSGGALNLDVVEFF